MRLLSNIAQWLQGWSKLARALWVISASVVASNAFGECPPPGHMIIEGDIIVPLDFYPPESERATFTTTADFWPEGIVYFQFASDVSADDRNAMRDAMDEWIAVAHVAFVPRLQETNYLVIQNCDENSSFVGMVGGPQDLCIRDWDARFIIAHELCHALGFWHEHSRTDRDDFVTVNWSSIQAGKEHNFLKHDEAGIVGSYDFDSLMHYDQCAFSISPLCPSFDRTITVDSPHESWQSLIGQRDHLSETDIDGMRDRYGTGETVYVDDTYAGEGSDGTLRRPYTTLQAGIDGVPTGGTVWIRSAEHSAVGTYSRAMTLRAYLGSVILGE